MRIFICMHYMELGGAERALLGLLEELAKTEHKVDLFIYSHQGELMQYIPEGINLLPEHPEYSCYEKPILQIFRQGHFAMGFARLWAKVSDKIHNRHAKTALVPSSIADEMGRATNAVLPSLDYLGEYDIAIGFLNPHYYIIDKIKAKVKVGWFHTDYNAISINPPRELPMWNALNYIVAVSENSRSSFLNKFPVLSHKTLVIENIMPKAHILQQAEKNEAENEMIAATSLLSIGRYGSAKNFPWAVEVMAELHKLRPDVVWYIIGFGDEEPIKRKIRELNMKKNVVLLGKKTNPYPYIKACHLYIQPSVFEGKSVSVREAQLLGKPVAVTNYPSASDQITHEYDGFIFPLGCPKRAALALDAILKDKEKLKQVTRNIQNINFDGNTSLNTILNLAHS